MRRQLLRRMLRMGGTCRDQLEFRSREQLPTAFVGTARELSLHLHLFYQIFVHRSSRFFAGARRQDHGRTAGHYVSTRIHALA